MYIYKSKSIEQVLRITELINVAYYRFPENFVFEGEAHDFWELCYVDKGQIVVQQEQNNYLLKAGEMIFCKPNVFHKSWVWQGKDASVVTLAFSVKGIALDVFEKNIVLLNAKQRQCVSAIVCEAEATYQNFYSPQEVSLEYSENAPYGGEQIIVNRLEELMISVLRSGRSIKADKRIVTDELQYECNELANRIVHYMQEHISEKITLQQLAQINHISISTLKRTFAVQTGCSVMSYLTALRIEEAKQMLAEHNYSLNEIAEKTGFGSVHYFSSVFKKHTGTTPKEFQMLRRNV